MEENKKKKKKLTINLSSKRSSNFANFSRGNKKSVIIEQKVSRPGRGERKFFERHSDQNKSKPKFGISIGPIQVLQFKFQKSIKLIHCQNQIL